MKKAHLLSILIATLAWCVGAPAQATVSATAAAERTAELQIRNLIEPLLDKYCHDECKLLAVSATVDLDTPDEIAPGFDDIDPRSQLELVPSSGKIKMLIDEKVGPISRTKLLELVQQYLDTLDFPVKIDTQIARFPQPAGAAGRVAELREKIAKRFRATLDELFTQFCPEQCLLADFDLQTEVVNAEEAQYGASGEFAEEGGVAVRIKDLSGTLLVDESLAPEERVNIVEMAKLKTNYFKNVNLTSRSMRFPKPTRSGQALGAVRGVNGQVLQPGDTGYREALEKKITETRDSQNQSTTTTENNSNLTAKSTQQNTTENKESANSSSTSSESNQRQERFERFEKIERVENGDAVQEELKKFKVYGLIFACSVLSLLIFLTMAMWRSKSSGHSPIHTIQSLFKRVAEDPANIAAPEGAAGHASENLNTGPGERGKLIAKRYEIDRLHDDLMGVFAQHPKVAKYVFSRILIEEGVETTSAYMHMFGESIVMDMLRDPSLQSDMNELAEFHAKNPIEIEDEDKLDLLRRLHNRTTSGKLIIMASRSSNLFDFLSEMDGLQILELIRNESLTVKSIIVTQCDPQKRQAIYAHLDDDTRMRLLSELSRIDYLPRDFIFNVATALKRKRKDNPRLNTEALPGSEVLLTLLERTGREAQRSVLKNLELSNPESARLIKSKLVSLDTLTYLRDGQLLEVILNLKHDELLSFLKGAPADVRAAIFAKSPRDLVADLEDELTAVPAVSRETYSAIERKVLNRMKVMANEGILNLIETNERMLAENSTNPSIVGGTNGGEEKTRNGTAAIKKVSGW